MCIRDRLNVTASLTWKLEVKVSLLPDTDALTPLVVLKLKSERDTLIWDEYGFAETKDLPYGTYTVHQTKGRCAADILFKPRPMLPLPPPVSYTHLCGYIFFAQPLWWEKMDSNHRSETQQIYSLPPCLLYTSKVLRSYRDSFLYHFCHLKSAHKNAV